MKRLFAFTLAVGIAAAMCSCGDSINTETTPNGETSISASEYTIEGFETDASETEKDVPTGNVDDIINDFINETVHTSDADDGESSSTQGDDATQMYYPVKEDGIRLLGDHAECNDDGVSVNGSIVTVEKGGEYHISGVLDDGQIIVNVSKSEKVTLVLNGVSITCSTSAPIYIMSCDDVTLTLAENTHNRLADGEQYEYAAEGENEPNATLFSDDDMTLNGEGSLVVQANYNNGITSKNDLKIESGTVTVSSKHDGIRGKDSVCINGGTVNVQSGGDAIKSSNTEETDKGYIIINGGVLNISASEDGIQAQTYLTVNDGQFLIKTADGSGKSWSGSAYGNASQASAKALKAETAVSICGGTFNIDSGDDAIHSNKDVTVSGGVIMASSGDDGIHADESLTISGGKITVTKSYEGLEGINITIKGGTTRVTASDDGINGAGGNDGSSTGRPGGEWGPGAEGGNAVVSISGGYLYINAGGDGLDSNGSFTMSGGTVLVDGPTNGGNGALDYNSSFTVSGGTLIASGSTGMAQNASASSTQCCVLAFTSGNGDTIVNITDENGVSVVTYKPSKQFGCILVSSPALKLGGKYNISTGGACSGDSTDGLYINGIYSGGNTVQSYTQSSTVMSIGGSGGGMGPGGMVPGGRPGRR